MYIEPMTIYREYIQNAADAIDEAHRLGCLKPGDPRKVQILIDNERRSVRIRDNGSGVTSSDFEERLTSFGASTKRGTSARGFRGVGRLAGLGYCQELIFRTRTEDDTEVNEMRWDCRRIKSLLRTSEASLTLQEIVDSAVEVRTISGKDWAERFFEVELRGLVRHKNDSLLNTVAIYDYLSEVAPVPFSPDFKFAGAISSLLATHVALGELNIEVEGIDFPVCRPHRNTLTAKGTEHDEFTEIEMHQLPSTDGGLGAVAWYLHHSYKGAIPDQRIKGLRLRSGNIQVGGHDLLQDQFTEARFNSWTVGEIHTVDRRIVPNGRRDHYEQNVHFHNLINHISPHARKISSLCRQSSIRRNLLREFQRYETLARENLSVIKQGTLRAVDRTNIIREVEKQLHQMRRLVARDLLPNDAKKSKANAIKRVEKELGRIRHQDTPAKALSQFPNSKRKIYEQVFALIYDCSTNQANAHLLVDRILSKLA
jgi:molecular chaperone HtpG